MMERPVVALGGPQRPLNDQRSEEEEESREEERERREGGRGMEGAGECREAGGGPWMVRLSFIAFVGLK